MCHDVEVEYQRHWFGEVVGHGQEGEVEGAEVEDESGEMEGRLCGEEVEECQDTQVGAGRLGVVNSRPKFTACNSFICEPSPLHP